MQHCIPSHQYCSQLDLPMMLLAILSLVLVAVCSSSNIYYVLPYNKTDCPISAGKNCYVLSHYISNQHIFSTPNSAFYFMEGLHLLDNEVSILNAKNLTFKGLGKSAIINCRNQYGGFKFLVSNEVVVVEDITITNCIGNGVLEFFKIDNLVLQRLSFQYNKGLGLMLFKVKSLHLESCTFKLNGHVLEKNFSKPGNLAILSFQQNNIDYFIKNISTEQGFGWYGGFSIIIMDTKNVSLIMKSIYANENVGFGQYGNIHISVVNSYINNIKLEKLITTSGQTIRTKQIDASVGAGLSLYLTDIVCTPQSQFLLTESQINNNHAEESGGVSLYLQGVYNCEFKITNSSFSSNGFAPKHTTTIPLSIGGGGLGLTITNSVGNKIILKDNLFVNNAAIWGGGLIYRGSCGNMFSLINVTFAGNHGYIGAALHYSPYSTLCSHLSNLTLTNVEVSENLMIDSKPFWYHGSYYDSIDNYVISSAISVYSKIFLSILTVTDITIKNNGMSGMSVYGCNIMFNGKNNMFINNTSPVAGGGLIITSSNSFIVNEGSHVLFANNTAFLGGAIFAKENDFDDSYISVILHNSYLPCTFQTNQSSNKTTSLVTFENNVAHKIGNDVYGGTFDYCQMNGFIITLNNIYCPVKKYWSLSNKGTISSNPFTVCLCNSDQNDTHNCSTRYMSKKIYPGQYFSVSLVAVGNCEGISTGPVVVKIANGNLTTTIKNQMTVMQCKEFIYEATPQYLNNTNSTVTFDIDETAKLVRWPPIQVSIEYMPCPEGFIISPISKKCICNNVIDQSSVNVQCNIQNLTSLFSRAGNNWVAYFNQHNCTVAHAGCPFNYCNRSLVSFNITSPDSQCILNRTGTLCGQCKEGLSLLLGSNRCAKCNNRYLSIIVAFIFAGILFIAILIFLDLTVSSGKINGLLFYANIVKINESVFFPNGSIPVLSQLISWLNLDFGIETCFYDGLNSYWKTWLQFAFPFYLWLLAIVIIVGCHYSVKLSRFCSRNAVSVLATLFLMSYTKLLNNITNVLRFTIMFCNTDQWILWSVNANLKYFSNSRIPLLIFSMILFLAGIIYTLLLFSSQWLQRCSHKCFKSGRDPVVRLKPFIDAYCGSYKDKCRFWTGLLLIVRLILTGVFSYTSSTGSQLNNTVINITVLLLVFLAWIKGGIYISKPLNVLEGFYYLNIGYISLGGSNQVVVITSVGAAGLVLSLVILHSVIRRLKLHCRRFHQTNQAPLMVDDTTEEQRPGSPANIIMRREELIFDITIDNDLKNSHFI